jgi:hypothetical protein
VSARRALPGARTNKIGGGGGQPPLSFCRLPTGCGKGQPMKRRVRASTKKLAANKTVSQGTASSRRAGNLSREVHPPHRNIVPSRLFRIGETLLSRDEREQQLPVDLKPPQRPPGRDSLWTVFAFTLIAVGIASAYFLWNNSAP